MKLKTTCTQHIISGSTDDFSHDAAVAHALLVAIGELQTMDEMMVTITLRKRAYELLQSWGYPDETS